MLEQMINENPSCQTFDYRTEEIFEIDLNEREKQEFDRSCDVIRGYLRQAEEMLK